MKKFRIVLRYGEGGEEKIWFFAYGNNAQEARENALKSISIDSVNEEVSKEEEEKLPQPTNVLCVDCFKGKLVLMKKGCNDAYCEQCGTDFIMTGENSFVYATAQNIAKYRKAKPTSTQQAPSKPMASKSSGGDFVSVQDFVSRPKIPYSEPISRLPIVKWETVEDINNGEKYNWVMVGLEKYGRTMYCTKTHIRRTTTMGEFYGTSPVD